MPEDLVALSDEIWNVGDWGAYLFWDESIQFDYPPLVKAGLRSMLFRGAQEQFDAEHGNYSTKKNLAVSREAGVEINGCYYWFYPMAKQKPYIDAYKRAIDEERPDYFEVDAEDVKYWDNEGNYVPIDPNRTADNFVELCDGLITAVPEIPFLVYSRPDWLQRFVIAKLGAKAVEKYEHHSAGWPDYGLQQYDLPLEEVMAGKIKQVTTYDYLPYPWVWANSHKMTPPKPTPGSVVRMWQTSSRIRPTYSGKTIQAEHQYDWNIFYGDMKKWAKKITTPQPETPPKTAKFNVWAPLITKWARTSGFDGPDPEV